MLMVKENFPVLLLFEFLMDEAAAQLKEGGGEVGHCVGWETPAVEQRKKSETKPNLRVFYILFPQEAYKYKTCEKSNWVAINSIIKFSQWD